MTLVKQEVPTSSANLFTTLANLISWEERLKMTATMPANFFDIRDEGVKFYSTNQPEPKCIDELVKKKRKEHNRPLMLLEYGFGFTTYRLLEICDKHDCYLATVEMPISPAVFKEDENYALAFDMGVDRYVRKYPYCLDLAQSEFGKKRWIWINDDAIAWSKRISIDEGFRRQFFIDGKIDYVHEDAIHNDEWLAQLYLLLKPHISAGGVFTGDDNTPTHWL